MTRKLGFALGVALCWSLAGSALWAQEDGALVVSSLGSLARPDVLTGRPGVLEAEKAPAAGDPVPGSDSAPGASANSLWKIEGELGLLSSKVVVHDPGTGPKNVFAAGKWQTENAMQLTVSGPIYVFGQMGAACERVEGQDLKLTGKTGLACKLPPWSGVEMLVRGGPSLAVADPLRPERLKEQSELLLEVQCRCPLPGKFRLEYEGSAAPALDPTAHDWVKHDMRLALPLGELGQVRLGARHNWENVPVTRPWAEGMQFYLGIDLKR